MAKKSIETARCAVETIVGSFGLAGLSEAEKDALNRAWHRLAPWSER